MAELVYGSVPHPTFQDRPVIKPEGFGWDDLGPRKPKFIVLHRMLGSLFGTDAYFRLPTVGALTDYGVGVEYTDGPDNAGRILRWNDPRGRRSGWASGPVSSPYGDGLCIVTKYGINAVNRDGVSVEISGNQLTPIDDKSFGQIANLCAYWCDQMKVPHDTMPANPHTGCSAFVWHQEFTIGTGKKCPFDVVMARTDELITAAAAIMKPYQQKGGTTVEYPPGYDAAICREIWGDAYPEYQFNEAGTVSRLWLANKILSPLIYHFKDTSDGRELFAFASGDSIGRMNSTEAFRVLVDQSQAA